jgi:hypothetical protein
LRKYLSFKESTLCGAIVDVGDTLIDNRGVIVEVIVQLAFIKKLRVISVSGLKFDGNLEVSLGVDALIDLSESAFTNFTDQFEIFSDLLRQM